jgi:shikimate dehydrogenase
MDKNTEKNIDLYAVIGNPINHSLSPLIHRQFAQQTHQQINYITIESPLAEFEATIHKLFFIDNAMGASITSPFKQQAVKICHHLTKRAAAANSVNCIKKLNNELWGDNTDGIGFIRDLSNHNLSLREKNILLLGAGGAAAGLIPEISKQNPREITICNRTLANAKLLGQKFLDVKIFDINNISEMEESDFIINTTIAHLNPNIWPWPILPHHINTIAYDLSYQPNTIFQLWATQNQLKVFNGLGMLIEQAAEAFYIWRDINPCTKNILLKK